MNSEAQERLLDVAEVAVLLKIKPGTVYAWVALNKIPFRKVGSLLRFHYGDLMEWTIEQARSAESQQSGPKKLQGAKLRVIQ